MSIYKPSKNTTIHIVGAGPAGLFSCFKLLKHGFSVSLYDQMPSVGRKFLIAGHSGLNLTHGEDIDLLINRYTNRSSILQSMIKEFDAKSLINFCDDLGVETFIGSSGRVFPKTMKAAEMLKLWMDELKKHDGFAFYPNHKLVEIKENSLVFDNKTIPFEVAILALGGASWPQTGSDGKWLDLIHALNIPIKYFSPVNVGLLVDHGIEIKDDERFYLKDIQMSLHHDSARGDIMITEYGIESGPVYLLGVNFDHYPVVVDFDLLPNISVTSLRDIFEKRDSKVSIGNFLRKKLKLTREKIEFLKSYTTKDDFQNPSILITKIKCLKVKINGTRPLEEAISVDGGVRFEGLNENLESTDFKGLYFAGEMLDWKAPTGGYLLQACFSTAYRVANSIAANYK